MTKIYHNVYPYDASVPAAVLFAILFFIMSILHLYQLVRTRTWYLVPFLLGGIYPHAKNPLKSKGLATPPA
ncbi:hypothetical protein E4T47_00050 [Aureobasidium subglaciale]|nr:hypothetical protein E4T47_00050 [Aureobasidium subglaciale]